MGYSCSYEADITMDAITKSPEFRCANGWIGDDKVNYFFEIGKENIDGAMTGSVYKSNSGKRVGGFKIASNGRLISFPHLPKNIKNRINKLR